MKALRAYEAMLMARLNETNAEEIFPVVNRLRTARFGVRTWICEDCGLAHPADDITADRKADGKTYPVCLECSRWSRLARLVFGRNAA